MADEHTPHTQAKLRRLAHPRRTGVFIALAVAVAVVAFGLGTLVRSPDSLILDARDQTIPVFATVESRVVTADVRIQGDVVGSVAHPIYATAPDGAAVAVVTRVGVAPGVALTNGALVGTVSDRPVFALSLKIPLFRDIHRSDKGTDVSSLQDALGVPATAVLDTSTLNAVRHLYDGAELVPPGGAGAGTYVRLNEFVSLPSSDGPPLVRAVAGVGTLLDSNTPLATLSIGRGFVSVRASVSEADHIVQGSVASVQGADGTSSKGTVTSIGEFQSSGTVVGRPPGRDIRIDLPEDDPLASGASVAVLFGVEGDLATAVPTLAIRSDTAGDYVLRRADQGTAERVPVTILQNANGWSAVDSATLTVGDDVMVSP